MFVVKPRASEAICGEKGARNGQQRCAGGRDRARRELLPEGGLRDADLAEVVEGDRPRPRWRASAVVGEQPERSQHGPCKWHQENGDRGHQEKDANCRMAPAAPMKGAHQIAACLASLT